MSKIANEARIVVTVEVTDLHTVITETNAGTLDEMAVYVERVLGNFPDANITTEGAQA